jgi:hypothetical protein
LTVSCATDKWPTVQEFVMTDTSVPFPETSYPAWQADYQAALVELDPQKLPGRVEAAETAIFNRLQAISRTYDNQAERQAIADALASLRVLKREMGFPDWEKK